jgi:dihydroorotate dehydrogenase (NAD+) catalytic subunit
MAGATAVQVGTATFVKPTTMLDIIDGLERYCANEQLTSLATVRNILGTVPKL